MAIPESSSIDYRHEAFIAVLVTILLLMFTWFGSRLIHRRDPREPAYISGNLPFVGHIIGMIRDGAIYFEYVNRKTQHPIFTLPVLTSRNYVVADPALAGYVQRSGKTLSFYALIVEVTRRLIAFDDEATRIAFHNMDGEYGPGGLMAAVHEMMNRHLGPGAGLDSLTKTQMEGTGTIFTKTCSQGPQQTGLYAWLRHNIGMCNMYAIYGPENIFALQPELEEAFWDFEDGMLGLVIDVCPWLFTRKAYKGRERVLKGLVEFVKSKGYLKASPLIRERVETNMSYGMSDDMCGHSELILMFGVMGNAVPSTFWLIVNIFSRPELLERIRCEAQRAIHLQDDADPISTELPRERTKLKVKVSAKTITTSCPLLYSSYRETLRDISLLTSARLVLEDTMLANKYFLRKDSVVQVAGGVIHHDEKIWGADAAHFNAERFIVPSGRHDGPRRENDKPSLPKQATPLPRGVPSAAFRAFGGGNVICPGRHFAQSELMTFAAVLALGFDCTQPDGSSLQIPEKDDRRIPLSVVKPKQDPTVCIRARPGWENVIWDIDV